MSAPAPGPTPNETVDRIGAIASSLCAVHCAVVALLPAVLGSLGLGALLGHEAEWVFTIIAIAFAAGAAILGWRRHKSNAVLAILAIGIVGLLASRGIEMSGGHHDHGDHHAHGHDDHGHDAHKDHHDEHAEHHGGKNPGDKHDAHGEHHDHHDQKAPHGDKKHDEHAEHKDAHGDAHHGEDVHGEHHGEGEGLDAHMLGTIVGVLAGLLLLIGHIMNIRATRRHHDECC